MTHALVPVSLAVDQDKIDLYAAVSDDFNPIHIDSEFAAGTAMGGIIAHGTMSLNLVWQSLRRSIPDISWSEVSIEIRFLRPVRVGDTVTSGGRAPEDSDGRNYAIWVTNQRGEQVISGALDIGGRRPMATAAAS